MFVPDFKQMIDDSDLIILSYITQSYSWFPSLTAICYDLASYQIVLHAKASRTLFDNQKLKSLTQDQSCPHSAN
jgi:hypothetical protein